MSEISNDQLRCLWREAGGEFEMVDDDPRWVAQTIAAMDKEKLLPFLRSFADRIRAEERERCARVAASYGDCGYECNKAIAEEISTFADEPSAAASHAIAAGRLEG